LTELLHSTAFIEHCFRNHIAIGKCNLEPHKKAISSRLYKAANSLIDFLHTPEIKGMKYFKPIISMSLVKVAKPLRQTFGTGSSLQAIQEEGEGEAEDAEQSPALSRWRPLPVGTSKLT